MAQAAKTLHDLIQAGADDATALSSPGGMPLTFKALRTLVERTVVNLNAHGLGRGDRIAIVLPNGPEMAAAFIAVAAGSTAAPLNPTYKADEFEFYMLDLKAKLLVVAEGSTSPAVGIAEKLGVAIAHLHATPAEGAGSFTLAFPADGAAATAAGMAHPDDFALVLHTSGTTSRPKIVPLKQFNVCASARNIRETLAFTPEDRALNIMPLFHIHGLIAGTLAPLSAGGHVCCTPGYSASKFFGWMKEADPTWYTAVPTMHQDILGKAKDFPEVVKGNRLRFVRSSSSSLPPQVMKEMEETWGAPVLEAYGMTEAAHQMASNPLPPKPHYAGSVGLAAGPEIAIVDDDGEPLPVWRPRRNRDPRRQRHGRLREQREGQCRSLHQARLVPHRRPGHADAGRLPVADRPPQGDHQSRRREDLTARGRRSAYGPSGGAPVRDLRHAA